MSRWLEERTTVHCWETVCRGYDLCGHIGCSSGVLDQLLWALCGWLWCWCDPSVAMVVRRTHWVMTLDDGSEMHRYSGSWVTDGFRPGTIVSGFPGNV